MRNVFGKTRTRFWTACRRLPMPGLSGAIRNSHKAREAADRMCETQTCVDLIQAYQEWASGAFERIRADGRPCQQQIMAIAGPRASPPLAPSATEKEVEPQRSESRAPA